MDDGSADEAEAMGDHFLADRNAFANSKAEHHSRPMGGAALGMTATQSASRNRAPGATPEPPTAPLCHESVDGIARATRNEAHETQQRPWERHLRHDREDRIGSFQRAAMRENDDAVGQSRCIQRITDLCALALRFRGSEPDHAERGAAIACHQESREAAAEVAAVVEEDDGLLLRRSCSSVVAEA